MRVVSTGPRALLAGVMAALLLAACTGDPEDPAPRPSPSDQPTGDAATLDPEPVPLEVRVTRLHGRMKKDAQRTLENRVGQTLSRYFDDAFLSGDYPRSEFRASFGTFSRGIVGDARRDADLLTHAELGPRTDSVTARRKKAWLSVLAPNRVAAGVTARFRLLYDVALTDESRRRVRVEGRLLLSRHHSGGWQIFGYDVRRNVMAAGKGDPS